MSEPFDHTRQHEGVVTQLGGMLLVVLAAVLVHTVVSFSAQYVWFRASDLHAETMSIVVNSEELKANLGKGITAGWPLVRRTIRGGVGEVSVRMPLRGDRGEATLSLRATGGGANWEYQQLEARIDETHTAVDLMPHPWRPQKLVVHGSGRLYFIPIGDLSDVDVTKLAEMYQQRYALDIEVLAPLPYRAHRESAKRVIAVLKAGVPELVADPQSVVIGITDVDMDWYSWRDDERFAVVSTSGLTPEQFEKQVNKNLGLLWFELPLSADSRSALYDGVKSTNDLDLMGNDY